MAMTKELSEELTRLRREWGPEDVRSRHTKDEWIRMLLATYTVSCPWEMDDCLYYAQKVYPDTTVEDIKRVYKEQPLSFEIKV